MKIYIENKQLDITQELSSLLTFAIDDIKDFGARNTTFSKTIVLPGTANNNALFGNIFDARVSNPYSSTSDNVSTNFNASVQAECFIFQNNIQIFKGTLRVLEIVVQGGFIEYECAVFGELGGFVAALGTNKLEDLDFSAYDQNWTLTNVSGTWSNNASGLVYPLIDYGQVSTDKISYDVRAFRPALFVREYLDKIITNAGYTWDSDLFNTARFKNLIIPNNQKSLQVLTNKLIDSVNGGTQTVIQNAVDDEAPVPHATRTLSDFTYSAGVYTYTGTDIRTFRLAVNMTGDYYSTIESIQIGIKKNGSQVYTDVPFLSPTFGTTNVSYNHTFPNVYVSLATGDTLEVFAKVANNVGSYRLRTSFTYFTAYLAVPIYANAPYGSALVINDLLPKNVLQKDFLSSVVKLFNLYIYEDNVQYKKLYIKPFVDFFDYNASGIVDWTYKVDRSKPISLKPMGELNSRYYNFKFKEDNDYYNELYRKTYNETYGDYEYDSEFEFTNDKTDVSLIFSPTVLFGSAGLDKVVSVMYKKNAGVEETYSTNLRILQYKKITGVTGYNITNSGANLAAGVTQYPYAGHYDDPDAPGNDIHFGVPREIYFDLSSGAINVTQFNVYWSSYMAEISDKDSKLMTCYVKLDSADIFNLNFSKPVYIDGSLWRLNKIEDWDANFPGVCKVELLKVINTVY